MYGKIHLHHEEGINRSVYYPGDPGSCIDVIYPAGICMTAEFWSGYSIYEILIKECCNLFYPNMVLRMNR